MYAIGRGLRMTSFFFGCRIFRQISRVPEDFGKRFDPKIVRPYKRTSPKIIHLRNSSRARLKYNLRNSGAVP